MAMIFIADDVSDSRERLASALLEVGHQVRELDSGWQLLEALSERAEPCELVVSDSRMGFPDGLSVATLARATGLLTPFLVLTGIASERARKVALGLGLVVLLEPPAELHRILEAASRLLDSAAKSANLPWVGAVELFDRSDE